MLAPGEVIPEAVTRFLAAQLGLRPDDLADYAAREETRREHLAALREVCGYKMFTGRGSRDLKAWLEDAAETARSNEDLARSFVEQCRATQTILPGITVTLRLCADALVAAERRVDARISGRLDSEMCNQLDALLTEDAGGSVTRFVWLRQFEVGQNSADMNRLLDRLEFLRASALDRSILADVPAHRVTRLRRQGERYFAPSRACKHALPGSGASAGHIRRASPCHPRGLRPRMAQRRHARGVHPARRRCGGRNPLSADCFAIACRAMHDRIVGKTRAARRNPDVTPAWTVPKPP